MNICFVAKNINDLQIIKNFKRIYDISEICEYNRYYSYYTNDNFLILTNDYHFSSSNLSEITIDGSNSEHDFFLETFISNSINLWNFLAYENPMETGLEYREFVLEFLSNIALVSPLEFFGYVDFELINQDGYSLGDFGFIFKISNNNFYILNELFPLENFNINRNNIFYSYLYDTSKNQTNCCLMALCYPNDYIYKKG